MARYRGPKAKIARRFREPIFGPSKALERKKFGPGQHGRNRRSKQSNYAVQLMEKQKAKYTYGLLEKQFRNLFVKATRRKGVTGEVFLQLLESRLDNTIYRMGFAPTRRAARQLVGHKHITVNGHVVNVPSVLLRPGDVVEVRVKSKALEIVKGGSRNTFPWLQVDSSNLKGSFLQYPEREQIPENIKENLIVELYSK
jgi:small subunit ribosomal protein S4